MIRLSHQPSLLPSSRSGQPLTRPPSSGARPLASESRRPARPPPLHGGLKDDGTRIFATQESSRSIPGSGGAWREILTRSAESRGPEFPSTSRSGSIERRPGQARAGLCTDYCALFPPALGRLVGPASLLPDPGTRLAPSRWSRSRTLIVPIGSPIGVADPRCMG